MNFQGPTAVVDVDESYESACVRLDTLIGTHYRPTGRDAAASFRCLAVWAEVGAQTVAPVVARD